MAQIITMPKFGLTMTEGNILNWNKTVGEEVKNGEPLFEVETDKITNQVESPADGFLRHIFISEGDGIPCGEAIAIIAQKDEDILPLIAGVNDPLAEKALPERESREHFSPAVIEQANSYVRATPRAKKMALDRKIDLRQLVGSGPNGIILSKDIQVQEVSASRSSSPLAKKWAAEHQVNLDEIQTGRRIMLPDVIAASLSKNKAAVSDPEDQVPDPQPLTGMRKVIASRMTKSWREVPHVTLSRDIDVTSTLSALEDLKAFGQEKGVKLTLTHLLVKMVATILPEYPYLNAWLDEKGIVLHQRVNIGVATAVPQGLLVPVLYDANKKELTQIAADLSRVVQGAKTNQLGTADLEGGTFTITNLGMLGVDSFTPIINQPQTGILGIGRVIERPAFEGERVVKRSYTTFSLSFDHRALDGADAAQFLQSLDLYLQQPLRLLLGGSTHE